MYTRFLKKSLSGQSIKIGGYTYNFIDIFPWEGDEETPAINVNVTTKNPFQSYCREKMKEDVETIILNKAKLIGDDRFSFFLDLSFNGREPLNIFVSQEDREKILYLMNKKNQFFKTENSKKETISFEIQYFSSPNFAVMHDIEDVEIRFLLNIRRIEKNEEPIPVNEKYGKYLPSLARVLQESILLDNDHLRIDCEEIIYRVLGPKMEIDSHEIYFNAHFFVTQINGIEVKQKNEYPDIDNLEDFN